MNTGTWSRSRKQCGIIMSVTRKEVEGGRGRGGRQTVQTNTGLSPRRPLFMSKPNVT